MNAAGDLSGTTLASNVVTSSLTTVGALASGSIATGFGAISTAKPEASVARADASNWALGALCRATEIPIGQRPAVPRPPRKSSPLTACVTQAVDALPHDQHGLVDGGDLFQGTLVSNLSEGAVVVDAGEAEVAERQPAQ